MNRTEARQLLSNAAINKVDTLNTDLATLNPTFHVNSLVISTDKGFMRLDWDAALNDYIVRIDA